MNLLPSDPLYWMIMADQVEENPTTILTDAFRTKIYNLYDQSIPQSANVFADQLSPDHEGDRCYAVGDFAHFNQMICPDAFNDYSGEGYGEGTADSYGTSNGSEVEQAIYNIEDDDV